MSPTIVCNNILKRAFDRKQEISPMKLQKLLYFVACEYQKRTHSTLFEERFAVWKYGPVLRSVHDEFRSYGKEGIRTYAKDAKGISYIVDESSAPNLRAAIDRIWNFFGEYDAISLSRVTLQDGSGWSNAYDSGQTSISREQMEADDSYLINRSGE